MIDWMRLLTEDCSGILHESPFSFSENCTIGCGGSARAAFFPANIAEMLLLVDFFKREGVKFAVLGNMSNALPADGMFEGALIFTKRLKSVGIGQTVFALAGVKAKAFLDSCERHGKSGAEFLAGIPCTIGGAVFMNAGAGGKHIEDILESALVYREGRIRVVPKAECGYSYKQSTFMKDGGVILGASFCLSDTDSESVSKERAKYMSARKKLPDGRSMGCVFKNPPDIPAGKLIEGAGLKGLQVGGAVISEEHANFILNVGGATSSDVRALVNLIKNAVFSQYGIALEEEIRYIDN